MTDFFYAIGDLFMSAFKVIDKLENLPNIFFLITVSIAAVVWFRMQSNYNKDAEDKGTYK